MTRSGDVNAAGPSSLLGWSARARQLSIGSVYAVQRAPYQIPSLRAGFLAVFWVLFFGGDLAGDVGSRWKIQISVAEP